jgi:predicted permease
MRFALRSLVKTPGFFVIAVAVIAIGIGSNTAMFSIVDAVLLQPLPFRDADRIVTLTHANPRRDMRDATISFAAYEDLAARGRMFSRVAAYTYDSFNLTGAGTPEQLAGVRVTAGFFDILGIPMALGHGFSDADDAPGRPAVVVLARRFWARRFAARPDALGSTLMLNGLPHAVVGALGIDLPPPFDDVDVWVTRIDAPTGFTRPQIAAGLGYLWGLAKLPPAVRIEQVQAAADELVRTYSRANPGNTDSDPDGALRMLPIRERMVGMTRQPLLILAVAVGIVLLIACANVANLLLVRATARRHEIAVRTAIGASRADLVRWLAAESAVLAVAGGLLGTLLAWWLVDLASAALRALPRGSGVHVHGSALAFSLAATVAAGLLFGLIPALRASRQEPVEALRGGGPMASPHARRLGGALLVAEVALSVVLLVAAGLLVRSFVRITGSPTGFRPQGLVSMSVSLPGARYSSPETMRSFVKRVVPAIEMAPGVTSAAASMALPPFVNVVAPYLVGGGPDLPLARRPFAMWTGVSPSYFDTMGIPLLAGRGLTDADDERGRLVVVVSDTLARRAWPNESAVGKRVLVGRFPDFAEVVGVVGDVKNAGLAQPPEPQAYTPYAQRPWPAMRLVIRAGAPDPLAVVNAVRAAVWSVDRELPVTHVETLAESMAGSLATESFITAVLVFFAAAALAIAATGLYGVVAQTVAQRTREVGIRVALGADAGSVLALVGGHALRLVGIGMSIGLLLAFVAARAVRSVVVGVSPFDPVTYGAVLVVLLVTAAAAAIHPARRALAVDPLVALRTE